MPLEVIREHRFDDGTTVRLPGGSRSGQAAAFDGLAPGLGGIWADHVATYADDWEVLRRGYLEQPWDPEHLPRELGRLLDSREVAPQTTAQGLQGRTIAAGRRTQVRGGGARPAQRPGLARGDVVRRAGVRRVVGARGHGRSHRCVGASPRDAQGHRRDPEPGPRPGGPPGPGRGRHDGPGRSRRGRRGVRGGSAAAAGPGAVRPAHDAGHPARGLPPGPGGRDPGPGPRGGPARRSDAGGAPRRAGTRTEGRPGPSTVGAGSPRICWWRWPGTRSTSGSTWWSDTTAPRVSSSSTGAGHRWACCGRAAAPSGVGSARPRRSPGVYAAGAHATPGAGLPVRGALRRAGRPGGRTRLTASVVEPVERRLEPVEMTTRDRTAQTVIRSAAKISRVALERFSV